MTPEERLTQTEKLLETAAKYIDRHSQVIEQNAADIQQLKASVNDVLIVFRSGCIPTAKSTRNSAYLGVSVSSEK